VDTASPRLRMSVIGVVVIGCFIALFARLWYLQIIEAPQLEQVATTNRQRVVAVEAPRGRILDVNGKVIVDNRTSLVVTVDRSKLPKKKADRDQVVSDLAAAITAQGTPLKIDAVEERLADQQYDPLQPVPIISDVRPDVMVYLSEHAEQFPGVTVERKSVRDYKYPQVAGNILGYVSRITKETLDEVKDDPGIDPDGVVKTYQPDSTIGVAGVEATYEKDLRGTPGTKTLEIDANNRVVGELSSQAPRPGSDIQLNIDIELQVKAEEAVREQLAATRGKQQKDRLGIRIKNAPAGSAVVLDPNTGAVRALATYPNYDPSEFVNGISSERYAQLSDTNGISSLIDRSIYGQYAPGSTFKLVTATAALNGGLVTANTPYNDDGIYELGGQPFGSTGANGYVTMPRALTVSSDDYFYWLGDRMDFEGGGTLIQDTAADFGFTTPTGIDLPNESAGYVLSAKTLAEKHEQYPAAFPDGNWYTGNNIQIAIGQYMVLVTPVQLASAYAALANGGTVYEPHVVGRVLKPGTCVDVLVCLPTPDQVVRTIDPVVRSTVSLEPGTRDPIVQGLAQVTQAGTASGSFAGFDQGSFPIVGKTGTAEVGGKADTSVFASYAPKDAPQYAVAAVMEESGFGSETAAPLVRHLYEYLAGQAQTPYAYIAPARQD
jgi:penicillin-binding protein 2